MSLALLLRRSGLAALALAATACTTLPLSSLPPLLPADDDCMRWFATLDAAVDAHGVRDAQDERIAGLPFLRVDRLAVAQRDALPFDAWLARAAALDRDARAAELANLPHAAFPLGAHTDVGAADAAAGRARSDACRTRLSQRVQGDAAARREALARARVPDRYRSASRALGAYALLRWPFFAGVSAWQDEHAEAIARWSAAPPPFERFVPAAAASDGDPWAPVFEIERPRGGGVPPAFDRFGVPHWASRSAVVPQVDTRTPAVYRRDAFTLYRGRLLPQRIYTLWFPERPPRGAFDVLAGALDGVIVRITLSPDGRVPLLVDTIHACGCWHLFFPAASLRLRDGAPTREEWAYTPAPLPAWAPGERLVVRIASATHHVTGLGTSTDRAGLAYALLDEQRLRALPLPEGGSRSLYGPDGLVPGTERAERFLFWPMGIASAGAMRQWGHHATAFVGRRHFDDADLIERRFELPAFD